MSVDCGQADFDWEACGGHVFSESGWRTLTGHVKQSQIDLGVERKPRERMERYNHPPALMPGCYVCRTIEIPLPLVAPSVSEGEGEGEGEEGAFLLPAAEIIPNLFPVGEAVAVPPLPPALNMFGEEVANQGPVPNQEQAARGIQGFINPDGMGAAQPNPNNPNALQGQGWLDGGGVGGALHAQAPGAFGAAAGAATGAEEAGKDKDKDKESSSPKVTTTTTTKDRIGKVLEVTAWEDDAPGTARVVEWLDTKETEVVKWNTSATEFGVTQIQYNVAEDKVTKRYALPPSRDASISASGFGTDCTFGVILRIRTLPRDATDDEEVVEKIVGIMEWPDFGAQILIRGSVWDDGNWTFTEKEIIKGPKHSSWQVSLSLRLKSISLYWWCLM